MSDDSTSCRRYVLGYLHASWHPQYQALFASQVSESIFVISGTGGSLFSVRGVVCRMQLE